MILTYPTALVFDAVPGVRAKHTFSLILGILFLQYALRETWVHSLASSLLCYLCVRVLPPSLSPLLVFAISIFWVSLTHVYRMWYLDTLPDPYALSDPSGCQMVLTIKLTSFAFNLLDGYTLLFKGEATPSIHVPQKIIDERRSRAIRALPSLLDYLSYIFFFGGILTGPAFDFVEYSSSIDRSKYATIAPPAATGASGGGAGTVGADGVGEQPVPDSQIPSPYLPSLKRVLGALIFLPLHLYLGSAYNYVDMPARLQGLSYPWRLVDMVLASMGERTKYYFLWLMAEGGCILCSLGYEGSRKEEGWLSDGWGALSNVTILRLETAESIRDVSVYWNKNTALWLRRYVYERLRGPYLNLAATYIISAAWHGFYPGYFLFFVSVGVAQEVSRRVRTKLRPHFLQEDGKTPRPAKRLYDLAGLVLTYLWICYAVISFKVLTVARTFELWGELYYFGHAILLVPLVVLPFIPKAKHAHHKHKTQ